MYLDSINENVVPVIDESIDESLKNEINNYMYNITFRNGMPIITKTLKS